MARRPKKDIPSGEWMNTYADMVTLLLCFFVLLFSMSSVNAEKWKIVVGSFNPDATILVPIPSDDGDDTGEDPPPVEAPEDIAFNEIYEAIVQAIREQGLEDSIDVEQTADGLVYINFKNDVLFDGDQYYLRDNVKPMLDILANAFIGKEEYIGEIRFLGHTDWADSSKPNNIYADRMLAAQRAAAVLIYIEDKGIIDGSKLVDMGYGVHYPIVPHFSADRALNRRTEILIMQNDYLMGTLDQVYDELGIGTIAE